jgi:transposase
LLRAEGRSEAEVAAIASVSVNTVSLWSKRFELGGLEAFGDAPGRGRKPSLPVGKVEQVITKVTQPPAGRQRWSTRTMASAVGISHQSVHAIWKKNGLKPHQVRNLQALSRSSF